MRNTAGHPYQRSFHFGAAVLGSTDLLVLTAGFLLILRFRNLSTGAIWALKVSAVMVY